MERKFDFQSWVGRKLRDAQIGFERIDRISDRKLEVVRHCSFNELGRPEYFQWEEAVGQAVMNGKIKTTARLRPIVRGERYQFSVKVERI
jgi:hypothetical protein